MSRKTIPSDLRRDCVMNIHLSQDESDMLYDIADKMGVSRTEFVRGIIHIHWRQAVLGEQMTPRKISEAFAEGIAYGFVSKRMAAKNQALRDESGSDDDSSES